MTNPQQNALAEALEALTEIANMGYAGAPDIQMRHIAKRVIPTVIEALASNNPAAVEGQGIDSRDDLIDEVFGLLTPPGGVWTGDEPGWQTKAWMLIRDVWDTLPMAALAPAPGQWQPIETAPKGERVLVYMPDAPDSSGNMHSAIHAKTANGHLWFVGHHFGFDCYPRTHWMPLPIAPNADREVV